MRLLVDDGVDDDRRLAGLAVADDQLALAAADGDQAVDGLDARLHRLVHRLARDDARRLDLDQAAFVRFDGTLAVDGLAQGVDHAAQQALAHRHVDDGTGPLDQIAFLDGAVLAEDDDADIVGLEVQGHALDAAGEFDHLAGLDLIEAVDAGDAVTDRENPSDLGDFGLGVEIGNLFLQNRGDFCGTDIHHPIPFMARRSC